MVLEGFRICPTAVWSKDLIHTTECQEKAAMIAGIMLNRDYPKSSAYNFGANIFLVRSFEKNASSLLWSFPTALLITASAY